MISVNSLNFYNYYAIQNSVLCSNERIKFKPRLYLAFFVKVNQKKKLIQTCELFYQFFKARPNIVSKFNNQGKLIGFLVQINLGKKSVKRLFNLLLKIRSGSRKKLISFQSTKGGTQIILKLRDFITLYNFRIKFYDFHDWRHTLTLVDNCFSGSTDNRLMASYYLNNFYCCFFKSPTYYGKIKKV
jgi:hypothetical protein